MKKIQNPSRRKFLLKGLAGSAGLYTLTHLDAAASQSNSGNPLGKLPPTGPSTVYQFESQLNLSPAKWIWYPSQRTLPNTFLLFRRNLQLDTQPTKATGWIIGDSRYILYVNGQRVQFGPPPYDPRFAEADPLDLAPYLQNGENVIAATVLFYGYGDGTWPTGKPGFIFKMEMDGAGNPSMVVSDENWKVHLAKSWPAGYYKRWYLRALQENFDARLHPHGWQSPGFKENDDWLPPMDLGGAPNLPALATPYPQYLTNPGGETEGAEIRPRSIPMMREMMVPAQQLVESHRVIWKRPVEEYFDVEVHGAFEGIPGNIHETLPDGSWKVKLEKGKGAALTFNWAEQLVGWPQVTLDAPVGTVVELMVQEGHRPFPEGGPAIMNNHFHAWSRHTCREGENVLEPFDFESLRWLQIHLHGTEGEVVVKKVATRRRVYPFPQQPEFSSSDPVLNKLVEASANTVINSAQETIVDGMGRERQQYSGDIGHELHALYAAYGEKKLPERYLRTFSQGMTKEGYFLDTWPAFDRLNRIAQRQMDLTPWGPLLDHGVGFHFDNYFHYLYTGDLSPMDEVFPRLLKFYNYLKSLVGNDGLLPVENIGVPTVWIDHDDYQQQKHKQCAFNLYASAMMQVAFPVLAKAMGMPEVADDAQQTGKKLQKATEAAFWDASQGCYVINKPWLGEEKQALYCDRSLSTALLYGLYPSGQKKGVVEVLTTAPPNMARSYPPNAGWYLWALAKARRADLILQDFRTRWINMESVKQNNAMQEAWHAQPDTTSQWSHAAVAPLYVAYMSLAGIMPLEPGATSLQIAPQLADLESFSLAYQTPQGTVRFKAVGGKGNRRLSIQLPPNVQAELVLDAREKTKLDRLKEQDGLAHFRLEKGASVDLKLRFS